MANIKNKKNLGSKKPAKNLKQKASVQKKSQPSHRARIFLIVGLLLLIVAVVIGIKSFFPCKYKYDYSVVGKDGNEKVALKLEMANNDRTRLKGLMGRKFLPRHTGMIFDFEEPGYYSMWMKDTLIPLDMVFVNNYGRVTVLAPNRLPMDETYINPCMVKFENSSKKMLNAADVEKFFDKCETLYLKPQNLTRYVIELPEGTIKENKIRVGDILLKK